MMLDLGHGTVAIKQTDELLHERCGTTAAFR